MEGIMPRKVVSMRRGTAPPYPALTIAKWFIAWAEAEGEELSNLKLQKLLYYAQGHHFAERHRPLFTESIQAWSHGPVVPDVYHEYKGCGSATIELPDEDPFTWDYVDSETAEFLSRVWNTYGDFSAGRLRRMTHEEPPWRDHFRPDERGILIPQAEIEKYFADRRAYA
jgi:uncharacterized phage-associated protein